MTTAILLISLGTLLRFGHLAGLGWNAVPLMAIALYAGARLPRKWAMLVPLATLLASDIVLDWGTKRGLFDYDRLAVYACLVLVPLAGPWLNRHRGILAKMGLVVSASVVFFLVTNFAVWLMPATALTPKLYPMTLAGLVDCFVKAIPFYRNTLIAELVGMPLIFGLDSLAHLAANLVSQKKPAIAAAE